MLFLPPRNKVSLTLPRLSHFSLSLSCKNFLTLIRYYLLLLRSMYYSPYSGLTHSQSVELGVLTPVFHFEIYVTHLHKRLVLTWPYLHVSSVMFFLKIYELHLYLHLWISTTMQFLSVIVIGTHCKWANLSLLIGLCTYRHYSVHIVI
jgi:hypothetical protein